MIVHLSTIEVSLILLYSFQKMAFLQLDVPSWNSTQPQSEFRRSREISLIEFTTRLRHVCIWESERPDIPNLRCSNRHSGIK